MTSSTSRSRTVLDSLSRRIIAAPMAGGPTTPELLAAAAQAGGLGFLAAGYQTVDAMAADIATTRTLLTAPSTGSGHNSTTDAPPFGVNLFISDRRDSDSATTPTEIEHFRNSLAGLAERFQVTLPEPEFTDYHAKAKINYLVDHPVPCVSFTFGLPDPADLARLRATGTTIAVTVTSLDDARTSVSAGADVLIVQGAEAGGHRSTFSIAAHPNNVGTVALLDQIHTAFPDVPLIAAGGIHSPAAVATALRHGASAVQVGTVLLLVDAAGTAAAHKRGLQHHWANTDESHTVVTRAYSGRPARAVATTFTAEFGDHAPAAYPHLNELTKPLRAAAGKSADDAAWNFASVWCGNHLEIAEPTSRSTERPHSTSALDVLTQLWDEAHK